MADANLKISFRNGVGSDFMLSFELVLIFISDYLVNVDFLFCFESFSDDGADQLENIASQSMANENEKSLLAIPPSSYVERQIVTLSKRISLSTW